MAPYNPPDTHYNEIPVETQWQAARLLRNGGRMLYDLTKKLKLKYIWYSNERKVLELWGPYRAFENGAKDKVIKKLSSMTEHMQC